LKKEKVT